MATGSNGREIQLPDGHTECNLKHSALESYFDPWSKDEYPGSRSGFTVPGPGYDSSLSPTATVTTGCDNTAYGTILWGIQVSAIWIGSVALSDDYNNPGSVPNNSFSFSDIDVRGGALGAQWYENYDLDYTGILYDEETNWWNGVKWYTYKLSYISTFVYREVSNPASYCPIGTAYNSITGGCDELDTYYWDEELLRYVPFVCIEVDGPNEIKEIGTYKYTIGFDDGWIDDIIKEDTLVTLSYAGRTGKNGIDFYAPTEIVIPRYKKEVKIEIEYKVLDENLSFLIQPSSETYPSCEENEINIFKSKYFDYTDYENKGTTCCRYYSLHYNDWQSCRQIAIPQYPGMMVEGGKTYIDGEY